MAWLDTTVPLLRAILQDISLNPEYSEGRLSEVLIAAAHIVLSEIDFDYTYIVDLVTRKITPDPVSNSDISFINMVCFKAALFILNSELKTAAVNSVVIKDASSVIDIKGQFAAQKTRYNLMLDEYNKVKMAIKMGDLNAGISILTPVSLQNIGSTYIWG
jgi:hypothetical protein